MSTDFTPILPVLVFILVGIMVAVGMLAASALLGPRRTTPVKLMPYESGMDPIGDARNRFDIRYYLVAIVFLLFDVELLFLYPWAVAQWSRPPSPAPAAKVAAAAVHETTSGAGGTPAPVAIGVAGIPLEFRKLVFGEILLFIAILAAAYAYAWRKGVFEWR
jgi:NADH-quinone oxidoreductase subunit A